MGLLRAGEGQIDKAMRVFLQVFIGCDVLIDVTLINPRVCRVRLEHSLAAHHCRGRFLGGVVYGPSD